MPIIRFSGTVVLLRRRTSTTRPRKVVDIGIPTIVGAAIRCHKIGSGGQRRRWLIRRLSELADDGDPTAKLVLEHLIRKPDLPKQG